MPIFIYSPYKHTGGGKSVQTSYSELIKLTFDEDVQLFSNPLHLVVKLFCAFKRQDLLFIQSIYNIKSLLILIIATISNRRRQLIIVPRGDRLPASIFSKEIKSSLKKYFYWKFFNKFFENLTFQFSSKSEASWFKEYSRIKIKQVIILPDSYITHSSLKVDRPHKVYPKRIVFLGRLSFEKNIDFLFEVYKLGNFYERNIELVIIGPSTYFFEKKINEYILKYAEQRSPRIKYCGDVVDFNLKMELISNSILCLPSLYESFGLVCLEAVEAGSFFIATNNSFWTNFTSKFGVGLDLVVDEWVDFIDHLINEGYEVDNEKRGEFLSKFHPNILSQEYKRQFQLESI